MKIGAKWFAVGLAGLLLIGCGVSAGQAAAGIMLFLLATGISLLVISLGLQAQNAPINELTREQEDRELAATLPPRVAATTPPTVQGQPITPHTLNAMQAVNYSVDMAQPTAIDIGLLVYRGELKPMIYRTLDIPDDADYLQPYLQLHVPLPQLLDSGNGRVRFEIVHQTRQNVLNHVQTYTLKDGLNLITPPVRLPVQNEDKTGVWDLRVELGDTPLAHHTFGWSDANAGELVNALDSDGELSDAVRDLLEAEDDDLSLSLDDLLAGGDESERKHDGE